MTENDRHKWRKRMIRSVNDDGGITKTNDRVDRKKKMRDTTMIDPNIERKRFEVRTVEKDNR